MYTVYIEKECGCFKKSEFEKEKSFEQQRDAYQYSNLLAEHMNEEFCTKHAFVSEKIAGNDFVIRVSENPNSGSCSTDSGSSCSSGSCGC